MCVLLCSRRVPDDECVVHRLAKLALDAPGELQQEGRHRRAGLREGCRIWSAIGLAPAVDRPHWPRLRTLGDVVLSFGRTHQVNRVPAAEPPRDPALGADILVLLVLLTAGSFTTSTAGAPITSTAGIATPGIPIGRIAGTATRSTLVTSTAGITYALAAIFAHLCLWLQHQVHLLLCIALSALSAVMSADTLRSLEHIKDSSGLTSDDLA